MVRIPGDFHALQSQYRPQFAIFSLDLPSPWNSRPVVGAWTCLPKQAEPVFVTFVADDAWHPQRVGSLVDWALRRAEWRRVAW